MFTSIVTLIRKYIFKGSKSYWETRYAQGGNSGAGSYGNVAIFKARILNDFVRKNSIESVIEFGCGDGHQLSLYKFPAYLGLDVSPTSIKVCADKFAGDDLKNFKIYTANTLSGPEQSSWDLSLSIDVIYHLVEDEVYEQYMADLFDSSNKHVIIYSYDTDAEPTDQPPHVKLRKFTRHVEVMYPQWKLQDIIENEEPTESVAKFFFYQRMDSE